MDKNNSNVSFPASVPFPPIPKVNQEIGGFLLQRMQHRFPEVADQLQASIQTMFPFTLPPNYKAPVNPPISQPTTIDKPSSSIFCNISSLLASEPIPSCSTTQNDARISASSSSTVKVPGVMQPNVSPASSKNRRSSNQTKLRGFYKKLDRVETKGSVEVIDLDSENSDTGIMDPRKSGNIRRSEAATEGNHPKSSSKMDKDSDVIIEKEVKKVS